MRNKELIANVPSISCVENYFLGWCAEHGISEKILFGKSFVPADEVFTDFLIGNTRFESYDRIPRIMDIAEENGVIGRFAANELGFTAIDRNINNDNLVLIEVGERFFEDIAVKPWRDDHFIWLTEKRGEEYRYLNNYPLSEGQLNTRQVIEIYGNKMLLYFKKNEDKARADEIKQYTECQLQQIMCRQNFAFEMPYEYEPIALRNAVGIIKIIRLRLAKWLAAIGLYESACFLDRYFLELSRFYVSLEAAILRERFDASKADEIVKIILDREKELSINIKADSNERNFEKD